MTGTPSQVCPVGLGGFLALPDRRHGGGTIPEEAQYSIDIKLPDGTIVWSIHTCNLDIPWLSHKITQANIVPGLKHSSLISTKKLCETGCNMVVNLSSCEAVIRKSKRMQPHINPVSRSNVFEGFDLPVCHPRHGAVT